ncbi:uncharacterized protein AB675_6859 [Cyphellophora attinorum]|uniref:SMP-30/Gluconolactonase/LRE-like region domain-containing protein n=1 Tax=Cyphellophora attinorum TaxID=1664694 RepID=A0A0N0NPZ3_9EURO|nr:uncharacterized protein AB675_6859 [Phialophora attinorum]KPI43308.1 hypothetical protein AB675_6859 [Phialophora attinorum]
MATTNAQSVTFTKYHNDFDRITGPEAAGQLLCESGDGEQLFHEACIYHQATRSVIVTSNQLPNNTAGYEATSHKHIKLYRIFDDNDDEAEPGRSRYQELLFPGVHYAMSNGGVNYKQDSILLCAQGSQSADDVNGIVAVSLPTPPSAEAPAPEVIVSDFHGIPFNSVNDVIVHPHDQSIWFTDPCYGHGQGIRPKPSLPNQVYRFCTKTKTIRAIADGFTRPNGLCFSPDLKVLYVTDTGAIHGSKDVPFDHAGPSHIYAFDIVPAGPGSGEPMLANKRLFAFAPGRVPDGIKCDTMGNVYSGCLDGVEVWNPEGVPLGVIAIEGGVANFCFGEQGVLYACNETRFWKVQLNKDKVRGALLGL